MASVLSFGFADIGAGEFGPRVLPGEAWTLLPPCRVPHGTPGAVSLSGLGAALVLSALPSLYLCAHPEVHRFLWMPCVAGVAGTLADSLTHQVVSFVKGLPKRTAWSGELANSTGVLTAVAVAWWGSGFGFQG
jgi:uncharacterized membrane protein